jgi:hypothetical protein
VECKRERLWKEWEEEDAEGVNSEDRIFVTKIYAEEVLPGRNAEDLRAMGSVATRLATAAHEAKGEQKLKDLVPEHYLRDYKEVFEKRDFDKLPAWKKWDHAIELQPGSEPVQGRSIPLLFRSRRNWMCSLRSI